MSITSERLRLARIKKGLKQTQVKEKTGINNKTLSGYENNIAEPDLKTLKTLAELYEVSVEWLVGNTNDPAPYNDEEKEVLNKINNYVPIEQIAAEHEITYFGKVLTQEEKENMLAFVETIIRMRKGNKKD